MKKTTNSKIRKATSASTGASTKRNTHMKTQNQNNIESAAKAFSESDRARRIAASKLAKEVLAKSETYIVMFYPELKAAALKGTDALLEHFGKMNGEYLVNPAFAESDEDAFVRAYAFRRMIHTLIFVTSNQGGMTSYLCSILKGLAYSNIRNWFAPKWKNAWYATVDTLIDGEIV